MLNYIGPNNGERITLYINGTEVDSATTKDGGPFSAGDGRIVVGRFLTDYDGYYTSLEVDELIFFNSAIVLDDIVALATAI